MYPAPDTVIIFFCLYSCRRGKREGVSKQIMMKVGELRGGGVVLNPMHDKI